MSFQFEKDKMYLMPVTFGPCVTPRQDKDGKRFTCENPIKQNNNIVVYESNPNQLEKILPPGFVLEAPYVIVNMDRLTDVNWLAGKGYDLVYILIPARYIGEKDNVAGFFNSVMWEGHPDPMITGRDQIAMGKVYGEIDYLKEKNNVSIGSISSWGFKFMEMELDYDSKPENKEELIALLTDEKYQGMFNYKYIPNTDKPTEAEIEYATLTPTVNWNPPPDYNPKKIPDQIMRFCRGKITWFKPKWEDMPTQHLIAGTLHDLEIKRYVGAVSISKCNPNDFLDTRSLH